MAPAVKRRPRRRAPRLARRDKPVTIQPQTAHILTPPPLQLRPRQLLGFGQPGGLLRRRQLRLGQLAAVDDDEVVGRPLAQLRGALRPRADAGRINGRLEALRRNALGFRNLTHYRWRSLLHSGALHSLVNAL